MTTKITKSVRNARQQAALDRFLAWAGPVGELTPEREAEIRAELGDDTTTKRKTSARKRRVTAR